MKRTITITGWQRPQLFRELLKSLAVNDLQGWEVFVQLEPSEFVEEYRAAAAENLRAVPVSFVVNRERLGIRRNPYRLLERAFDEGADLVLYLEEDLLLAQDATALALWFAKNHRPEWMCLSLLSGGCGSKGFISDRNYPNILFAGKNFNSLGFAVRREEWDRHFRPAWFADWPLYDFRGAITGGWDWSVYRQLLSTLDLFSLQPAAARATHTGRAGVNVRPEWHDSAFKDLELAEASATTRNYQVLKLDELPGPLRRHALLWDEAGGVLKAMNESMSELARVRNSRTFKIAQWLSRVAAPFRTRNRKK